jgi:hypothetical protein
MAKLLLRVKANQIGKYVFAQFLIGSGETLNKSTRFRDAGTLTFEKDEFEKFRDIFASINDSRLVGHLTSDV